MEKVPALLLGLLCCVCLHTSTVKGTSSWNYTSQSTWPGVCSSNTGHQSPIDINTTKVVENSNLTALNFSSNWGNNVSNGVFENKGHSVQITLNQNSPSITTNTFLGNYQLDYVQFHWGTDANKGSEHRINGEQAGMEIQFVHSRIDTTVNASAVIAVLASATGDEKITGIWESLALENVTHLNDKQSLIGLNLSKLLPNGNRDYYYYNGSFTQPNCAEGVQWFVLKNRITVSSGFLRLLRMQSTVTRAEGDNLLNSNTRNVQELGRRIVMKRAMESNAVITGSPLLAVLPVALFVIVGL